MSKRNQYSLVAAIVAATLAPALHAQDQQTNPPAPAPAVEPVQKLDEVTVTGSRIKRATDYSAPTPTTVIDSSVLDNAGVVNLGQALAEIPSNLSTFSPANTGNSSFNTGSYLADLRGLNPFFGSRTLTLIDTKRAVQTNQGDSFDLNFIPQVLVQRIDTVTGGASAAYGSGAVSGVVNVILDRKLEGGKFNGDIAQTEASDGQDRHFSGAYGFGLMDDRIHIVLGGEYEHQDPVGCQNARSWCAADKGWYQSGGIPNYAAATTGFGSSVATYSVGKGLHSAVISSSGAFFPANSFPWSQGAGPTSLQLTPDGTGLIPYSVGYVPYSAPPGTLGSEPSNVSTVIGGDGNPTNKYVNLMPQLSRGVIAGMLTAKVTDDINFKLDWNWGKTTAQTTVFGNTTQPSVSVYNTFTPGVPAATQNIFADNAYVQQQALLGNNTLLNAVNSGYNSLNKDWFSQDPLAIYSNTTVKRFTAGFDGKVPFTNTWTWETYYEYGLTNREQYEPNQVRSASLAMAMDSVLDANGQPACRVTVAMAADPVNGFKTASAGKTYASSNPALAAGCVPINPFGTGTIPSNAFAYSFGNLDEVLRYEQTVVAANATGEIFKGVGAGAWSAAIGYEWRQEKGNNNEGTSCLDSDLATPGLCQARSQDFGSQFGTPFGGLVTVNEAYLEGNLPLLKDLPFVHALEIDVAGRFSHYNNQMLYAPLPPAMVSDPTADPNAVLSQTGSEADGHGHTATHNLVTWKVSGFYEPVEGVRVRGSQSRDMRAADLRELYYGQQLGSYETGGYGICSHPGVASTALDGCTWNLLGNVNLAPETSDTTTVGIVLSPVQVPGLQVSADWFHIKISNAISPAATNQVELACAAGDAAACNQMQFKATNGVYDQFDLSNANCTLIACTGPTYSGADAWQHGINNATAINATSFNGAFYDSKGVDFSVSYALSLPDNSTLFFRSLATWMGEQKYQNYEGGPVYNILGQTGGVGLLTDFTPAPRWRGNTSITWTKGILSLTPSMSWVGTGILSYLGVTPKTAEDRAFTGGVACGPDANLLPTLYQKVACGASSISQYGYTLLPDNHVPSYFLFNLNATLNFEDKMGFKGIQLYAQINNLFNRAPPLAAAPGGFFGAGSAGTNPVLFDTLGMDTRVGFRLTF